MGILKDKVQLGSVFPRVVRGYYYMPDMPPYMYCIEISGNEINPVIGKCEVLREADGKIMFLLLDDAKKLLKGEFDPMAKTRDTDIFNHLDELALTERIYIVAPGENGKDYYDQLDPECFTIIVNKACELDIPRRDLWMVSDPTVYNKKSRGLVDWFATGLETCESIGCFDSGTLMEYFDRCRWTHEWAPEIKTEFMEPVKNRMRGGITIAGRAVQMAYWLGAKEIVLCGVDMDGMHYFDGTDRGTVAQKHTAWTRVRPLMNELIKWVRDKGVRVLTLSPSALQVPHIHSPVTVPEPDYKQPEPEPEMPCKGIQHTVSISDLSKSLGEQARTPEDF